MNPQPNQIYRHFKGNLYRVITLAEHTETEETLVIYQAMYGELKVYARPLSMFCEEVDRKKYPEVKQQLRFEPIDSIHVETPMLTETIEETVVENVEEEVVLDPLVEAYLDTDSYREKLNILHGLHHRITENMLNTMAIVIDFDLPEGDIQKKYEALNDCLLTKERYECNRIL